MTEKIVELSAVTNEMTESLSDISATRPLQPSDVKPLIKCLAESMNSYSAFIEEHNPVYAENVFLMSTDIRNLIYVSKDFAPNASDGVESLQLLRGNLEAMVLNATVANESMLQMRDTTASLQRTTTELNKAKRRIVKNIDGIIEINKNLISSNEKSIFELDKLMILVKSKREMH